MYTTIPLLAALLVYPLVVFSQTTTDPAASQQTIVPSSTLPACIISCGKLFDVQGGCVPPQVAASASTSCFCGDARLQLLYTTTSGVFPGNTCSADDLTAIQQWFLGYCSKSNTLTATNAATQPTAAATGTAVSGSSTSAPSGSSGNQSASWVSSHWQWIIMITVLSLAIVIGWIAACFFRRRYIRKREREYELRPPAAPWLPGQPPGAVPGVSPYGNGVVGKGKDKESAAGMFMARQTPTEGMSEKPGKKKWVVKERT